MINKNNTLRGCCDKTTINFTQINAPCFYFQERNLQEIFRTSEKCTI